MAWVTNGDNGGGGNFEPVPSDIYEAICYGIIDLGHQDGKFGSKPQLTLRWELVDDYIRIEIEGEKKRRALSKIYGNSMNEKATLRIDLESWRGKKMTEEESKGFDLEKILEKRCRLVVSEIEGKNKITQILPSKIKDPIDLENEIVNYNIARDGMSFPESFSDKMKAWIMKSDELKNKKSEAPAKAESKAEAEEDDEIPF